METVWTLAFTFYLLSADPTVTMPIHTEREVAFYDREGGSPVKSMEDCKIIAKRRKERAEEAIRASDNKLFDDYVEVTCLEYQKPIKKQKGARHGK